MTRACKIDWRWAAVIGLTAMIAGGEAASAAIDGIPALIEWTAVVLGLLVVLGVAAVVFRATRREPPATGHDSLRAELDRATRASGQVVILPADYTRMMPRLSRQYEMYLRDLQRVTRDPGESGP